MHRSGEGGGSARYVTPDLTYKREGAGEIRELYIFRTIYI